MIELLQNLDQSWLATTYIFDNSLLDYLLFILGMISIWLITKIVVVYALHHISILIEKVHGRSEALATLEKISDSISGAFYIFFSFYISLQTTLVVDAFIEQTLLVILLLWTTYHVLTATHFIIDYLTDKYVKDESETDAKSTASAIKIAAKIIVWSLGLLLVLSNLGINITSLVAGLGIGGIAVAFALQNLLADLFSSFAIYFDKPFKIGDFIILDQTMGTVEKIGIKTTRIRALQGEEIILPNQQLTNQEIHNYKQMQHRRIEFKFKVTHQTSIDQLKSIPKVIEDIISGMEKTIFDRAHFKTITDSAFEFEVVYNIDSSDYALYMNTQQEINLQLLAALHKHKIKLAYPTTSVFLQK